MRGSAGSRVCHEPIMNRADHGADILWNFQGPRALSPHATPGRTGSRRAPFQGARAAEARRTQGDVGLSRRDRAHARAHRRTEAATPRARDAGRAEADAFGLAASLQTVSLSVMRGLVPRIHVLR